MAEPTKVYRDREVLQAAHEKGKFATFLAFFRLSGPGWLQSAITLGGGSLGSALFLGVLGGSTMMWLNLIAIIVGVIMLSAISYVVLSSGRRPYQAINEHVNPVLGVGWITATILANVIWCMAQFSLCFDTLDTIMLKGVVDGGQEAHKWGISAGLLVLAFVMVFLSLKGGWASKIFDIVLKLLIAMVVICFVAAVVQLFVQGKINADVFMGFIPDFGQWFNPTGSVSELLGGLPDNLQDFWSKKLIKSQRDVMISTTATAVGINMTFLLPYSMLNRGWDRPFRGLAMFDLITGMAIPFILVTSSIILASAHSFHAKADDKLLSSDPAVIQESRFFQEASKNLAARIEVDQPDAFAAVNGMPGTTDDEKKAKKAALLAELAPYVAKLSEEERKVAATLVKPNSAQLAQSLRPLFGEGEAGEARANLVFGFGAFGMGFSTIVILMLINGYAVAELFRAYDSMGVKLFGAAVAGIVGACWPAFWQGDSKTWLIIVASTFGAILLPIAYVSFFALMNSRTLLGDDMPRGGRRWGWNILMAVGVVAAFAQALSSLSTKLTDASGNWILPNSAESQGILILGGVVTFGILALIGFSAVAFNRGEADA